MKGMFRVLSVSACVVMLFVGCARKPKINLANLRENTVDGTAVPENGPGFVTNDFSTSNQPAIPGINDGETNANENGKAIPEDWSDMKKPVEVGEGTNAYINNPQPWNGKVYFDYNRSEIKQTERPVLDKLAEFLIQNGNKMLVIDGESQLCH